jgi:cell division protein FtsQ
MNVKAKLIKIFTVMGWCLLGVAGLAILIAAINSKNSSLCQGMEVEINGGGKVLFLNKKDLRTELEKEGLKDIKDKKMASFDLQKMENILRRNTWIRDVQLYFDNNQTLKIRIQERQPVARMFSVSGNTFLIDSAGVQMPVPDRTVFRLPVFTGYPQDKFGIKRDSTMNRQILNLAIFLNQDPFWSGQIQEVNIQATKTFHMTPLIGNQVIEFGDGNDYENKFHRLYVFYKVVMSQTGFEKYTAIKLGYSNQVIATRKEGIISRADSIQARKNVMEMIRMAQKMETDTGVIREVKPLERNTVTEQTLQGLDLPEENENQTETNNKHQKQQQK